MPAMPAGDELEKLLTLMAHLRGPSGCPWDREQTMSSLRPFVLEEAYELVEAIGRGEAEAIREELGDLLLEIVFVNQIAVEEKLFEMDEVIRGIHDKLVRRHPHVFETERVPTADKALERWEQIKEREKKKPATKSSALDGVAKSLAALARAQKISARAAKAGFDWKSAREVKEKLAEELEELDAAVESGSTAAIEEEMGDVLFALSNLARHLEVDAEVALTGAIEKFSERFRYLESSLGAEGRSVSDASMDELDELWEESKRR